MSSLDKIFTGAYEYFHSDTVYSEENFEVYQKSDNQSMLFRSETHTRMANGEFLKILTDFHVGPKGLPDKVNITKYLGSKVSTEAFKADHDKQSLLYSFEIDGVIKTEKINTPSRYHIQTPDMVSTFLFIYTKTYDVNQRNEYALVCSDNVWEYKSAPTIKYIYVESRGNINEEITIHKSKLKASKYFLYEDNDRKKEAGGCFYLSRHHGIPYLFESIDGKMKITIKFLTDIKKKNQGIFDLNS